MLQEAGSFEFLLSGCGAPPEELPAVHVSARLHTEAVAPVEIRNPFDEAASFSLALSCADSSAAELRLHGVPDAPITVEARGVLRFHVAYTPRAAARASARVLATCVCACCDAPVVFEVPVEASVAADTCGQQVRLRGKAKQLQQHTLHLPAPAGDDLAECGELTASVRLAETCPPGDQVSAAVVRASCAQCRAAM